MKIFALLPLLLLSLPPSTASQRGPLTYRRSFGRYGHRSSYGSYGHGHRSSKTVRAKYPSWEPWVNKYKKSEETADPVPESNYKTKFAKAAKMSSLLKKSGKIRYIKTTPRPTTRKTTTTTTTKTTTESFDEAFELGDNNLDRSNIRAQRLTIEVEELQNKPVTPPSVDSSTKGWSLILDGFSPVPAVPMEYVRPSFMPVPAVPENHDDI